MLNYFPKYFTSKAIYLYIGGLLIVSVLFSSYIMSWYWYVFGITFVVGFFYSANMLTRKWSNISVKTFTKNVFWLAVVLRLVWVVFSYFFYTSMTGKPFEFHAADSITYNNTGNWIAYLIKDGNLKPYFDHIGGAYSDAGYSLYVGLIYSIFGQSIIIVRLIKVFLSAWTCILIYKLTSRTFNESIGRMAAIFCMLMPNLIYYCGLHLKETEMLFLTVAFIECADSAIRSPKLTFSNLILPIVLSVSLFFFRTVLGASALFAFFTALLFIPGRTLKGWKRVVLIAWVLLAVGYFLGGKIATEVEEVWERRDSQSANMEWRAEREGGNQYARYMSGAVFAPMIFVIPFPTMLNVPTQENQQLLNGGNYVKNIMAFFVMFALIWAIRKKEWRNYALIGSFTIGYLLIISFSAFAHSERFHLPVLPFELIIAAYGVSLMKNKNKKYYTLYLVFMFFVLIGWNWFKLSGRGLI